MLHLILTFHQNNEVLCTRIIVIIIALNWIFFCLYVLKPKVRHCDEKVAEKNGQIEESERIIDCNEVFSIQSEKNTIHQITWEYAQKKSHLIKYCIISSSIATSVINSKWQKYAICISVSHWACHTPFVCYVLLSGSFTTNRNRPVKHVEV